MLFKNNIKGKQNIELIVCLLFVLTFSKVYPSYSSRPNQTLLNQSPKSHMCKLNLDRTKYSAARKKYKWLKPELYKTIWDSSKKHNVPVNLILSLIQSESNGKQKALGKVCNVTLIRKGKRVKENHRAFGFMQVMDFHYKGNNSDLYNPEINIDLGTKILARAYHRRNRDLRETLKDYNSGPASDFYNEPYIKAIISRL